MAELVSATIVSKAFIASVVVTALFRAELIQRAMMTAGGAQSAVGMWLPYAILLD
ncbi:unannotated protein [freshwater metagenome]|uniref:Unannotated protein n=1 Tax=freshwater metagenome TaxID=449393 RepID=A0A6J7TBU6_9ZZZZ